MARIKAAIFDMDGTLVTLGNGGDYVRVFSGLYRQLLGEMTGKDYSSYDEWRLWEPMKLPNPESRELLREWGIEDADGFWSELAGRDFVEREKWIGKEIVAYPDALELLERLYSDGVQRGILTNAPEAISSMVLERLGLDRYFEKEDVISSNYATQESKPSPRGINALIERWRVPRERVCIFGDACTDVNAGLNAGLNAGIITAQLFRDGEYHHENTSPHFRGKDLLELWRKANEMQMR
jgi:phosphoglycolate phosphatase-like HAD superfamily hydrolase